MRLLEAKNISLNDYLTLQGTGKILKIPYSQRPYEWGKIQANRLFEDFIEVFKHQDSEHILNFITVYSENTNTAYIYDGQQRTVSSILFIAAIVRFLKENNYVDLAKKIINEFLLSEKLFGEMTQKIIFEKDSTNNIIKLYISEGKSIPDSIELSDYEKALKTNYDNYHIKLKAVIQDEFNSGIYQDTSEVALKILQRVLQSVYLILLETTSEEVAIKMFDTLNSTGQQLEDFYILKNYFVQLLGEENVKEKWDTIEDYTNGLNKNRFLLLYASVVNGKTVDKNKFAVIKKEVLSDDINLSLRTLDELVNAAKIYSDLDSPQYKNSSNKKERDKYINYIGVLKKLRASQYKSLIMAMELKNYKLEDVNTVLSEIIKLQVRNIFIGQALPATVEKLYPTIANEIFENKTIYVLDILQKLKKQMMTDEELKERFNSKKYQTTQEKEVAKYLLREIYNYQNQHKDHNELLINPDTMVITLEHILPEQPKQNSVWIKTFNDNEREVYTHLIGNFTLLLRGPNSSASNNDFELKKDEYKTSQLKQNQLLSDLKGWNKTEISKRNAELFAEFNKIWNK